MSLQHSQNKKNVIKTKKDKVDEDRSIIAEYKRCAILKYCNENGIKTNHLDELSISNDFHSLGLYYFVLFSVIFTFLKSINVFYIVFEEIYKIVLTTTKLIYTVYTQLNLN